MKSGASDSPLSDEMWRQWPFGTSLLAMFVFLSFCKQKSGILSVHNYYVYCFSDNILPGAKPVLIQMGPLSILMPC